MKRITIVLAAALTVIILLASVSGCSNDETTTNTTATTTSSTETTTPTTSTSSSTATLTEEEVRSFADPIATTMLEGLSEGDLEKYTRDAAPEFKNAIDQETMDTSAINLEAQVGTFVSAEYKSWEMSDGYIIVHYSVEYTGASLGVRLIFNQDHLVSGQWFE